MILVLKVNQNPLPCIVSYHYFSNTHIKSHAGERGLENERTWVQVTQYGSSRQKVVYFHW